MHLASRAFAVALTVSLLAAAPAAAGRGPGSRSEAFRTGSGLSAASPPVAALTLASPAGSDKVLVGGYFSKYKGTAVPGIAALNTRGDLVAGFDPGSGPDGPLLVMVPLSSGKTLVGGNFTSYNGMPAGNVARLNADGSLDRTFKGKANGEVTSIAVASGGDIVIAGQFSMYGKVPTSAGLVRLHANGRLDRSLRVREVAPNAGGQIQRVLVDTAGKILIGGAFTGYAGQPRSGIARLKPNGALDTGFEPGEGFSSSDGLPVGVYSIKEYRSSYLVGGAFDAFDAEASANLVLIDQNGAADPRFGVADGFNAQVNSLSVQRDGRVIAVGNFDTYRGNSAPGIVRLHKGGSADTRFKPGAGFSGGVSSSLLMSDGRLLAGGFFSRYDKHLTRGLVAIRTR